MSYTDNSKNFSHDTENLPNGVEKPKVNTKIIIIILIAVVVCGAVIAAVVISAKNKNKTVNSDESSISEQAGDDESVFEPVSMSDDVDVTFDSAVSDSLLEELENHTVETSLTNAIKPEIPTVTLPQAQNSETTTKKTQQEYLEGTTKVTDKPDNANEKVTAMIKGFFDSHYYVDGTMTSDGVTNNLEMAMNGKDFHVFTVLEGMDIAMMFYDGTMYLLNPENKKYMEINGAVKKMLGLSEDDFKFGINDIKFDYAKPESITKAEYKGKAAVCYSYKNTQNGIDFIAVGDELRQIIQYGSGGEIQTIFDIDEFSVEIPSEMFNFKGYSKANMISFMKDLIA